MKKKLTLFALVLCVLHLTNSRACPTCIGHLAPDDPAFFSNALYPQQQHEQNCGCQSAENEIEGDEREEEIEA